MYNTTTLIDKNGLFSEEVRTPAGTISIYGYYTEEVVIDPETRDSHDVFTKIYNSAVALAVSTAVTHVLLEAF